MEAFKQKTEPSPAGPQSSACANLGVDKIATPGREIHLLRNNLFYGKNYNQCAHGCQFFSLWPSSKNLISGLIAFLKFPTPG